MTSIGEILFYLIMSGLIGIAAGVLGYLTFGDNSTEDLKEENDLLRKDLSSFRKKYLDLKEEHNDKLGRLRKTEDRVDELKLKVKELERMQIGQSSGTQSSAIVNDNDDSVNQLRLYKAKLDKLTERYHSIIREREELINELDKCQKQKYTSLEDDDKLSKIAKRANEIDFSRIGFASSKEADDLKRINGIGPFIEEKLNAVGIYTFNQISQMDLDLADKVNEAIEFFPGRIIRDNWIGQAKDLMK